MGAAGGTDSNPLMALGGGLSNSAGSLNILGTLSNASQSNMLGGGSQGGVQMPFMENNVQSRPGLQMVPLGSIQGSMPANASEKFVSPSVLYVII